MGKGWKRRFQSLKSDEIWGYVMSCDGLLTLVVTRKLSILMHGMMACAS